MRRLATLVLVLSTAGLPAAFAQSAVGTGMAAPIGITSPLGIGAGAPVAPTGIPLGATELATPGVSPSVSSGLLLGSTMSATTCSGALGSVQTAIADWEARPSGPAARSMASLRQPARSWEHQRQPRCSMAPALPGPRPAPVQAPPHYPARPRRPLRPRSLRARRSAASEYRWGPPNSPSAD